MTDNSSPPERHTGLIVGLSDDLRPDEADAVATAIRMIKGVAFVQTADDDPDVQLSRERVNAEWRERIVGLLDDEGV